eukprot:scaffold8138_cov277-Pinguiococcus_pyrenoidosus.AAC.1
MPFSAGLSAPCWQVCSRFSGQAEAGDLDQSGRRDAVEQWTGGGVPKPPRDRAADHWRLGRIRRQASRQERSSSFWRSTCQGDERARPRLFAC